MSMEWRGGNHIVPVDYRDDHLPDEERCEKCDALCSSLLWDGLCVECRDALFAPHPDCDDDPLRYEAERIWPK